MFAELLQYLFAGLTSGAIYALAGLGFAIIYNASHVINFAQGEFIMIGGMATSMMVAAGLPLPLAILLAVVVTMMVGVALEKFAIEPARNSDVVTIIIITIGASIFLRGLAQVVWDKEFHSLPAFSGETPINVAGATLMPQSIWVVGISVLVIVALWWFFNRTLFGKAMLATSFNRLAAQLMGIGVKKVLMVSFALSALLGAVGGIVVTPITFTNYEAGIMLGLKGFSAAVLGGLGNGLGAIVGGLVVGIAEALASGYLSSAYKDAVAFVIILFVLFFLPNGLFGKKGTDRV
ncbi:High-affinity branched-chain amino acid transport system permease protein livH [Magnetospirillum sp. LM-5]|uniref:branched-chain amino acid ABC transporter permease n=1 Tax=Magnetospirillum sp. LM-5 TaxID=2681466 RepID=UPI0013812771|nr:branched-chain amino acid ABC transporter permease [Magnetospirillum sp. LM-5]CAA7612586.1 High-affinity branched-chain amino acid transport system permease protein livH [Magnetospirillum sp. LM-5]